MRYDENDRESSNIDDRRGQRGPGGFRFPGGGRGVQIPIGGKGGMSITTLLIIGGIMLLFGINPLEVLLGGGQGNFPDISRMPEQTQEVPRRTAERNPFDIPGLPGSRSGDEAPAGAPKAKDEMRTFIGRVLADTEDIWNKVFESAGRQYKEPQLVLFTGATQTRCGVGQSAMGPFYCPLDQKLYIDLGFFDEEKRRFNAPGDFAQAYVIAHEVGHHVQTLLGISEQVQRTKQRVSQTDANRIQVMMELQADCLAGVWASLNHQLNNRLEDGDIDEGLNAAKQIGDDMIQKRQQGYVVPDSFTHGSSEQRKTWFTRGFKSGEMKSCDTFNAETL